MQFFDVIFVVLRRRVPEQRSLDGLSHVRGVKVFPVLHEDGLEEDLDCRKVGSNQLLAVVGVQAVGTADL